MLTSLHQSFCYRFHAYRRWHERPEHKFWHWFLIASVGVFAIVSMFKYEGPIGIDSFSTIRAVRATPIQHDYTARSCYGGINANLACTTSADCPQGICLAPVASWWNLDEASGTRLASGGSCSPSSSCNLTDNNTVAQDAVNYKEGSASAGFTKANNEYLSCNSGTNCTALNVANNITFGCWGQIRDTSLTNYYNIMLLGTTSYGINYDMTWNYYGGGQTPRCSIGDGVDTQFTDAASSAWSSSNAWYHSICRYSNTDSKIQLFLNGQPSGVAAAQQSLSGTNSREFDIGGSNAYANWDGLLDECFVSGSALTDNQICEICRFGLNGQHSDRGAQCGNCNYGAPPPSDAQAPTQPTNLTAAVVSSSQIDLNWTASTDNVGVTGYNIYRNSIQVSTSPINSYSDTGLSASTTYTYTVSAHDAAGNESIQSLSASATTQAAPPIFDFSLNTPSNISVTQGQSGSNVVTATLVSGTSQSIAFSASNLPTGATASFSPASCGPNCSTTLTISTAVSTPAGNSTITVTATGGGATKVASFTLTVNLASSSGPVAAYSFDEGSGSIVGDASGNNNNGSFIGAPQWLSGANCKFGNCLKFPNGWNYVNVPDAPNLNIPDNLTISLWLRGDVLTPTGSSPHPVRKYVDTTDNNFMLYYCGGACAPQNTYRWYANRGGLWGQLGAATPDVAVGAWNHMAIIYQSATGGQLYWNGNPVGSPVGSGLLDTTTSSLRIGNDAISGNDFSIDEVRIYNRVLTQAEIQNDMNAPINTQTGGEPPPPTGSNDRGYQARPSGYTSYVQGVCNGGSTSEDVDGNGVADKQVYVDASVGNDTSGNGSTASPYRTIQRSLDSLSTPQANQIQAVCFSGTFNEALVPTQSGASGFWTRPKNGSEERDFQFPRYPFVLSGWDRDADGQYPPYDPDDTAVLDGNVSGNLAMAIDNNTGNKSNLEIAHFAAKDYALACPSTGGFMAVKGPGSTTGIYVHDLQLSDIASNCANTSALIVFSFWGGNLNYGAIENVEVNRFGSYFARGIGPGSAGITPYTGPVAGPWRFKNISLTALAANNDGVAGVKLWNYIDGIEVLDSIFNANLGAWTPGAPSFAVGAHQCSRGWTIRNNTFLNWYQAFEVAPDAGPTFCQSRSIDGLVFDRNTVRTTINPWSYGHMAMQIVGGPTLTTTVENVTISNNIISSSVNTNGCIWLDIGNNEGVNPGSVKIVGNTCAGPITQWNAITVRGNSTYPQRNYLVKDNIIAGLGAGNINIGTTFAPLGWQSDGNVYDPSGDYVWNNGPQTTLTAWRTASGQDAAAKECTPSFVNSSIGDFHLNEINLPYCARDAGVDVSPIIAYDFDGDARPQGAGWDIGADEYLSGTPPPPVAFDFSLNTPSNITVAQGSSGNTTINASLVSGTPSSLTFSASGLPSGATASFSPTSCSPTCSTTLTITTTGATPTGTSTITVTAISSSVTHTATFSLTVTDASPPTIFSIQTPNITASSSTISWTTSESASSRLDYGPTTSYGQTSSTSLGTFHTVTLSNLSGGTIYHYRITATDSASNAATTTDRTFETLPAPDGAPPAAISDLTVVSGGPTSLNLDWTAPGDDGNIGQAVSYTVKGSSTAPTDPSAWWTAAVTYTGVPIPAFSGARESYVAVALTPATTYYFAVRAADEAGNSSPVTLSDIKSATTAAVTQPDSTAPTISSLQVTGLVATSATVTWNTNEPATSLVEYGTTGSYGLTVQNSTAVTAHTLTLSGLSSSTLYHYRVVSTDSANNTATSGDQIFTTLDNTAPVISTISAAPTTTTLNITWATDEPADSQVEYDLSTAYGSSTALDAALVMGHSVQLTGLTASTSYHYRIKSKDSAGNIATSADQVASTNSPPAPPPDTIPPTITNVQVASITSSTVTLTWTTNESATSKADYGITANYGATAQDNALVTSHSLVLSGLARKTAYRLRVYSKDVNNNEGVSSEQTFTTLARLAKPPAVTALQARSGSVVLSWSLDTTYELATSLKVFRSNGSTGLTAPTGTPLTTLGPTATGYTDSSAAAGSTYTYTIFTIDDQGTASDPATVTIAVPAPPPSGGGGAPPTGPGGGGGYIPDTTPPGPVTNLQVQAASGEVRLTWISPTDSDFVRTTIVRKSGATPSASVADGTVVYEGTAANFTDTGLTNGQAYSYALFTLDRAGNRSRSVSPPLGLVIPASGVTSFTTSKPAALTITLTADQLGGLPLASAVITLTPSSSLVGGAGVITLTTDTTGKVIFRNLIPGTYTLNLSASGRKSYSPASIIVKAGEDGAKAFYLPRLTSATPVKPDSALAKRLAGRILLQVESKGEAWYVHPQTLKRYYLGRPADAFRIMREQGLGITNANLSRVPEASRSGVLPRLLNNVSGRILLQVESKGEAWYIHPQTLKRHYLGRPADAFRIMREQGLGITTKDLMGIEEAAD